ncbi:uncharacterized protein LOC135116214 [Scylla paramamosain]|uniref:uncharacterized protein LOC135116214 n=1 Tax=Scylla paramamosain TaxID=85552 RepID=UPI0030830C80
MELVFPLGMTGGAVATSDRAEFHIGESTLFLQQPLSLCLWLKAAVSTATARIISYFYKDIVIFVSRSGAMISIRTESQLVDVHEESLTPRTWHQLCLLRSPDSQVHMLLNGRTHASMPYPANDSGVDYRQERNGKAIASLIRRAEDRSGKNFTNVPLIILGSLESEFESPIGRIADVRMYWKLLSTTETETLRMCSEKAPEGTKLEIQYTTEAVMLRKVPKQVMCSDFWIHVVTYTAYTKQGYTEALCTKLGGWLPAPQNFDDLINIADILPDYSGKPEMYFWLSNNTNKLALGMSEEWCCAQDLRHGGSLPMSVPCSSWARDFVCFISHGKSVHLLHSNEEIELFFGDVGENYLLVSDQGYSLTAENGSYVLRNLVGVRLGQREGQQITDIIGLRDWIITGGSRYSITLSTCHLDQFTCQNGDCLELERRCDKFPDCSDGSDEDNCHYLQPPPANYRSFLPPSTTTAVSLTVDITDIHDINMKESQLGISVTMELRWMDPRLTFTNMANKTRLDEALDQIWKPTVVFVGAKYEDNVNLYQGVNIMRFLFAESSTKGVPTVVNSSRALMQDGHQVRLILQLMLDLSVTCSYDLVLYPFDVQECGLNLALASELTGDTHWDSKDLHANHVLPQPALYGATIVKLEQLSKTEVVLRFLLERWYGSYMLTSYLPCLILLVIGTATQLYPVTAVSDRVMVTLSCLIVLASLLAQASATLPESASSKAIEVWFSYTIARMFLVSMVHTAVYRAESTTPEERTAKIQSPLMLKVVSARSVAPQRKPQKYPSKHDRAKRINHVGLTVGLALDLVFIASYFAYILTIRNRIFHA